MTADERPQGFDWDDVDLLYDEATFRGFCALDSGIDGEYSPDRAKQRALIDLANRLGDLLPPRENEMPEKTGR